MGQSSGIRTQEKSMLNYNDSVIIKSGETFMKKICYCLSLLTFFMLTTLMGYAQDTPATSAYVIQIGEDGIPQMGETTLPSPSLSIDWNPQSNNNYARVDDFGILRFSPIGSPEGVYSFAPYFQGFSTPSRQENRLFVDETKWSPNGQQLAFRISSGNEQGNDGVWFWQPAQETVTDPSYHLLRDCPPGCRLVNSRDTAEWKSLSMDWSEDNVAILVHMYLPEEDRNALGLVFASRDPESPQADIQPPTYRYEYGSWANDGQRLVVSGYDVNNTPVFGFLNRDGSNPQLALASDIGLAYVRDTVENPTTGALLMLGSTVGKDAPMALYTESGVALTGTLGNQAPDSVVWSPNHDAVLVDVGTETYIATINGIVYNITSLINGNPLVSWVESGFPANTVPLVLTQPVIQAPPTPITITVPTNTTPIPADTTNENAQTLFVPQTNFAAGQLLQVAVDSVTLRAEPIIGAEIIKNLPQGEALVLIGGPLTDGVTVWWRIQTLDFIGWAEEAINGVSQFSS